MRGIYGNSRSVRVLQGLGFVHVADFDTYTRVRLDALRLAREPNWASALPRLMIVLVLLDLDGTLTDPYDGITRCVLHALEHLHVPRPDDGVLRSFIGPPLQDRFAALGLDDATVDRAIALYRERFSALHALNSLGIAAGDAVMVGDRAHDIEGARAHGMRSIGVAGGTPTPVSSNAPEPTTSSRHQPSSPPSS